MLLYKLIKAEVSEIYMFERLVTESLAEGWELAGGVCVAPIQNLYAGRTYSYLIQPMTKEVTTKAEWLAGKEKSDADSDGSL